MEHIFMPDDQTNQKLFSSPKSIPFCIDLVYILVHFTKFSFINFVVLNAEKSSSLHTIILEKQTQTKHLIALIFICVYFSFH